MDLSKLRRLSQSTEVPVNSASPTPGVPQQVAGTSPPESARGSFCPACGGSLLPGSKFCGTCGAQLSGGKRDGAEVWIGVAVGLLLLFVFPRFTQWISSRLFKTHFNDFGLDNPDGTRTIVPYPSVPEFWSDLGPTLFAFVLIADGIVFGLVRNRTARWLMFAFTCAATAYNLIYLVGSYSKYGLAIGSAAAVIIGGYIATYQWSLLRTKAPTV